MNKIIFGDCLELMKDIPAGSVDMILCDLPYGTTQNKWDSLISLDVLWAYYNKILKLNGVVCLTAQTPFDKILGCSNLNALKYEYIWVKNVASGHLNSNKAPMKKHENVLIFYKKPPTYNKQKTPGKPYYIKRGNWDDNGTNYGVIKKRIETDNKGDRNPVSIIYFDRQVGFHPTQKPVPLFEYLIKTYTNPGDTVLDNCSGSGTTAIACINTGRNFICMEKDEIYYRQSVERVNKHYIAFAEDIL